MNNPKLSKLLDTFPDDYTCLFHLEKLLWNGIPVSPFEPNSKVYYCKDGKYKCRDTGKYFNVKTNTIFHNSKIPLQKWFAAIWILSTGENGLTSVQLSKELEVSQKTAWFMIQRIKKYFEVKSAPVSPKKPGKVPNIGNIDVIVEQDRLKMTDWLNLLKK